MKTWTTTYTNTQVGTSANGDLLMKIDCPTTSGTPKQFLRLQVVTP